MPPIDARALLGVPPTSSQGEGIVVGLIDTPFDPRGPDLEGADVLARDFTGGRRALEDEHGTYSLSLLVAQGRSRFRGLLPRARVLFAEVVGSDGLARPERVAAALDWQVRAGSRYIALPMGQAGDDVAVADAIERTHEQGVMLFAAAGRPELDEPLFPARHPRVVAVHAGPTSFPGLIGGGRVVTRAGSSVACVIAAACAILARPRTA